MRLPPSPTGTTRCTKMPGVCTSRGSSSPGSTSSSTSAIVILAGGRAQRIEVARRLVVHQVAVTVAAARAHEREVGDDPLLEDVVAAVVGARLLLRRRDRDRAVGRVAPRQAAVGDLRADAGRREERRDARAARAQPFGQRPLRHEFDLELAREKLALELLVLARRRSRSSGECGWLSSSTPSPQPSTPQLLETVTSPVAPCASNALMRTCGMPHSPNPPTASDAPSEMSATASAGSVTTLSMPSDKRGCAQNPGPGPPTVGGTCRRTE